LRALNFPAAADSAVRARLASAGFYEAGGKKFPRLQILTAAQILDNRSSQMPFGFTEAYRKAEREGTDLTRPDLDSPTRCRRCATKGVWTVK
jgi:hypothetical protein